jgi:formate dehydrogenase major subunit
VAGLAAAFGSGAMTNTIADIEEADVILITGSNTTENHPRALDLCQTGRDPPRGQTHRGGSRRIKMTEFAENWLRPNLGTDVAWINGMMHVIISEDLHDKTFVEDRTENFEELKAVSKNIRRNMWRRSPAFRLSS